MLGRFYDVMEYFNDDIRLAAFAITEIKKKDKPVLVYNRLLDGQYKLYIDDLEDIVQNYKDLKSFNDTVAYSLDMANSNLWSIGDFKMLEINGWKLEK